MDLEHLTKHQIILLTLLVSFVASIATGIVTVSLMNQAPPSVTRTINQIVERTVQTVVPATNQSAAVVTTEKTVVVKNDDVAAQSIATVQKSIIRITAKGGMDLIARGVIIDNKGMALTDSASLIASGALAFDAILSDGERVPLTVRDSKASTTNSTLPLAVVDVSVGTSTGFAPAQLTDVSKLKLGQSVIRIGGKGTDTVGEGVIATLPAGPGDTSGLVEASVSSATPGSVLTNLFGEVIGIATTYSLTLGSDFYSITSALASTPATKSSPQS